MLINKDHISNLLAADTTDRFLPCENPEGFEIWYDTYTGSHFIRFDDDSAGLHWYKLNFVASIQKRIWENWDELATPRDENELRYLDENPELSVTLVSSNGVVYIVWFSIVWNSLRSVYLPVDKPTDDDE